MVDPFRRRFRGMTPLAIFIAGTIVLAIWLGSQAFAAAASHRRTAEAVLSDYARISASEMARIANGRMDDILDEVFAPVHEGRLRRRGEPPPDVLRRQMDEAMDDERCACPGFRSPVALFRIAPEPGRTAISPDTLHPGAVDMLLSRVLAARDSTSEEHGLLVLGPGEVVDGPVVVGFTVPDRDDAADLLPTYGFIVGAEALTELFEEWYSDEPLLPQPIAGGQPNDSLLHVAVADRTGTVVFEPPAGFATDLSATARVADEYGGLIITAAVRPDAASDLVIGGLPRSRLPLITALLMLTMGVGIAAVIQLRREQMFQRLRDDFVSGVSHELRTPLAQIRMFAELQQTGKLADADDSQRAAQIIHRESVRLSHLVENILQFSRFRRPTGHGLPAESIDLARALDDGLGAVVPLLAARGMRLEVHAVTGTEVEVNRDALTRILVNLLDNAVKYGPEGQTIEVRAERMNGVARLSVADEGPGVPPKDRQRIWKAYFRLERDVRAQVTGTGIGLSVVSDLASEYGGRAWVEDVDPTGARFVVELPVAEPAPPPSPALDP